MDIPIISDFLEGKRNALEGTNEKNTQSPKYRAAEKLASEADNKTVTADHLLGNTQYFYDVISYLEKGEHPQFLFPLTKGSNANPALIIESGGESEEAIPNSKGGTLAVTDRYIRIQSRAGEWTLPYNSIVSVDRNGHPGLEIATPNRTYQILVAGFHFNLDNEVAQSAQYIRKQQRQSNSSADSEQSGMDEKDTDNEDPFETLEKLEELREKGVLTEEEFSKKKEETLDKI